MINIFNKTEKYMNKVSGRSSMDVWYVYWLEKNY